MVQEYINFLDNITPLICAFLTIYKFIQGETKLQKIYFLGKKKSDLSNPQIKHFCTKPR